MIVYRLCKPAHSKLDGEGARLWGGRWNSAGRSMVYTAASPSLAVLELLVHLDLPSRLLPDDYQLLTIAVPDGLPMQVLEDSPANNEACLQTGNAFLDANEALVLKVRSVVVPQEWNLLLNAQHPDMGRVTVERCEPFRLDPRLRP